MAIGISISGNWILWFENTPESAEGIFRIVMDNVSFLSILENIQLFMEMSEKPYATNLGLFFISIVGDLKQSIRILINA